MGLFHCDIEFRNTVLFEENLTFKLIDFDYLFKVKLFWNSDIEKQAYLNMVAMLEKFIKKWKLKDDKIIAFLFKNLDESN